MKPEEFDPWFMYQNYVCVLATNSSCCYEFLDRAEKLNPDFGFIGGALSSIPQNAEYVEKKDADSLEAIGGGFNITLEALQDISRRSAIAAKIREFAACADEIVQTIQESSTQS